MPRDPLERAKTALAKGEVDAALTLVDRAIDADPASFAAWLLRGQIAELLDETSSALDAYARAADLDPTAADPELRRGSILLTLGRLEGANAAFASATQRDPANADAVAQHAANWLRLGNDAQAIAIWDDALARAPDNAEFHRGKGLLFTRAGRHAESIPLFERAIALDPESAAPYLDLGSAHFRLQAFGPALAAYDDFLAKCDDPDRQIAGLFCKAMCHLEGGEPSGALEVLGEILDLDPDNQQAAFHLGQTHARLEDYVEAAAWYDRAVQMGAIDQEIAEAEGRLPDLRISAASLSQKARVCLRDLGDLDGGLAAIDELAALEGRRGLVAARQLASELADAGMEDEAAAVRSECQILQDSL